MQHKKLLEVLALPHKFKRAIVEKYSLLQIITCVDGPGFSMLWVINVCLIVKLTTTTISTLSTQWSQQ